MRLDHVGERPFGPSTPVPSPPATGDDASRPRFSVAIAGRTLAAAAAIVAGVWVLERIWPVVVALIVGLVLFGTCQPLVRHLEKRGWRRSWATLALCAAILLAGVGLGVMILPPLWTQVTSLVRDLPKFQERAAALAERFAATQSFGPEIRHLKIGTLAGRALTEVYDVSSRVLAWFGYTVTALVLAVYFLIDPEHVQTIAFSLTPRRHHLRLARVLREAESIVGGYVRGQLITSAAIFVFALGLFSLLRIPNALSLAAFACLADVVPFIGGLLAILPAALAAIDRGPWTVVAVVASMAVYQEIESRVIVPRVYGRVLRLSSPAVILSLLIGGELMGIVGALLAIPAAATIRMLITELRVELPGDDHEARVLRAKDSVAEHELEVRAAGEPVEEAAAIARAIAEETDSTRPK